MRILRGARPLPPRLVERVNEAMTENLAYEHNGRRIAREQFYQIACDPARSVVVEACAGAGKTWDSGPIAHLRDIDLTAYGMRPRGLKTSPTGNRYAITMEASGTLVEMEQDFKVIKAVPTGARPYGLAFDHAGKRIFVAAAGARKLQVFSADSMQLMAEIPIAQRCWHFTFTPDDSQILLACGRSNNVIVVDAHSYRPIRTIEGFKLPWGIVTYPKSYGSLDLP